MTTHEQYRPQEYARTDFARDHEFPPHSSHQYAGQMTAYQPTSGPVAMTQPLPQPQQYQQNAAVFDNVYGPAKSGNRSTADRDRRRPHGEKEDESETEPQTEQQTEPEQQKTANTGGPLLGAATGAVLGANIGSGEGYRAAGTLGGVAAGALIGNTLERASKDRRQKKEDSEREVVHSAQQEQDRYNDKYTKIANAAPGYGSCLLPSDTSHGGSVNRNSRATPAS